MTNENNNTNSVLTEKLVALAAESANLEPAQVLDVICRPD
jgi:hypothetical protein